MAKQIYHQGETVQLTISAPDYNLSTSNFVVALYRECFQEAYIFNKSQLVKVTEDGKVYYTLAIAPTATKDYKPGTYTLEVKINDTVSTHVGIAKNILEIMPAKTKELIN